MKQFVKALDKEGRFFKYLETIFTNITLVKLKESIFDGPQIRQMFRNDEFVKSMNDTEKAAVVRGVVWRDGVKLYPPLCAWAMWHLAGPPQV